MENNEGGGGGLGKAQNRGVLSLIVRALNDINVALGDSGTTLSSILTALQDLAPTTLGVSTVAGLPAAAAAGQGARRLVTDANSTTFLAVAAGGGANVTPVFSDGTNWRLG